ncbi:sensor histidine kinase [Fulvimonas yonginensis]|uniref:histidine kinase n=2 Tax=Fulvimonas yonginensis TaxID=1495200 RepID=A0ABU8JDI7_9GAMM
MVGYAVAVALSLLVWGLELAFSPSLHRYLPFTPVIFVTALACGRNPALLATLLGAVLADRFYLLADGHAEPFEPEPLFLLLFVGVGAAIATLVEALAKAVRKLIVAEEEKSLLLDELAHRTRNDLMMISQVLAFQARRQSEPQVRAALESAVARVRVVAEAQERLRSSGKHGRVEVASYLQALGHGLADLLRDVRPITVRVEAAHVLVEAPVAVSIGLIANELVTNAFKYAFPEGRGGTVQVRLEQADEGMVLTVEDDGVGCPMSQDQGLGSRLVQMLAAHMGGQLERVPVPQGHRVRVKLPIKPAEVVLGKAV